MPGGRISDDPGIAEVHGRALEAWSGRARVAVLSDYGYGAVKPALVEPVRKGARGADVVHTVRQRSGAVCGKIIWETKRAENWSNAWVGKLKDDQQAAGGELAVLVSTAFPAGIAEPMVVYEGIWLVRPDLVRALAEALRTVLIESQRQKAIATGHEESKDALYHYVTSPQFAQKVRAVVDACAQMREDLEKERAAMARLWKKREAQIERASSAAAIRRHRQPAIMTAVAQRFMVWQLQYPGLQRWQAVTVYR